MTPTSVSLTGLTQPGYLYTFSRGEKSYELTNHLGNVLSTITDKKIAVPSTTNSSLIDHFTADVASAQDYYPFGMQMPGRTFPTSGSTYRYGFNGKEQDPEVEGTRNFYDYGMRGYDPRVGRFVSVDPLTKKYPWYTPYSFAGNKPIVAADLDGLEEWMRTQENLLRENAILRIDATRVKEQSKIPQLGEKPYEDQEQQYQHEQNSTRLWNAAGYNDDGSKPFLKQLSDNKTWNNFAENLALPLLKGASYVDGAVEVKAFFESSISFLGKTEFDALATTGTVDAKAIRFSQNSIASNFKDGSNVEDLINQLKSGKKINIEPIRIVQKDNMVFTLDNRRLYAYQQAGIEIPYTKLDAIPAKEGFKFTTTNNGVSIEVRTPSKPHP